MYNPLLDNIEKLKDNELEAKINDLTKKWGHAARMGNGSVCSQIETIFYSLKEEQRKRQATSMALNSKNQNLNDLIKVDK
jgi:hypothetical protein